MTFLPKFKNRIGILLLFLGDFLTILTIFHLSVFIRAELLPRFIDTPIGNNYNLTDYSWIFLVWFLIVLYEGGYSKRFATWDEIKFLCKSAFFSAIAIFTMLFIMKRGHEYSRALIITMTFMSVLLFPLARVYYKRLLYYLGLLRRKILIIGSGEAAKNAYKAIRYEPNLGYEVAGFIDDNPLQTEIEGSKVYKGIEKIGRYIRSAGIHDVIVAKPELEKEDLVKLLNHIQHKAENTLYIPDMKGIAVTGTELRHFFREQSMMIEISNNLANPLISIAKRILDYCAAVLITAILSIPMLVIALRIKLSSPGPATYRQKRVGKNGKVFWCYKFRTMYPDAATRLHGILEKDPTAKKEWEESYKLKNDPRVTPIGDFLRRTSLDELPQFLNILKGEMSLVGPRPVVQEEIDRYYREDAIFYFMVPPGLTGLWQVSGRSNTTYEYRVSLDSWYVKNWNLWLDLMILFKTVGVVVKREGAV